MSKTITPGDQIQLLDTGKTTIYLVNGITFPTYGLAFRAALADLKAKSAGRRDN